MPVVQVSVWEGLSPEAKMQLGNRRTIAFRKTRKPLNSKLEQKINNIKL
jgi:hypothetical protein